VSKIEELIEKEISEVSKVKDTLLYLDNITGLFREWSVIHDRIMDADDRDVAKIHKAASTLWKLLLDTGIVR
jgi:hypothetical protein